MDREPAERSERWRAALAAAVALGLHGLLYVGVERAGEKRLFRPREPTPVTVEIAQRAPAPEPEPPPKVEPEPKPEPRAPPKPRPQPPFTPRPSPPPAPAPEPLPDVDPAPAPAPAPALLSGSDSPVRLPPREPGLVDRVLGQGTSPFGTGLKELEGALEHPADGPMSDEARAEVRVKRMIEDHLAEDAVAAGLADDYFRKLKERIEVAWKPAQAELNDKGRVSRLGFMTDAAGNAEAYGELWLAYLDLAQQYARGEKLTLEKKRVERIRELMRSREGAFRFHAIAEVVLTQAADGKVLTIEMPHSSGHPGIDEGIKEAIETAVAAMPDPPPSRLSFGRAFRSHWRLRATWRMVPPTSLLAGNSFDIGKDGVEVDVPFQVKLLTKVMLLSFDNRDHSMRPER